MELSLISRAILVSAVETKNSEMVNWLFPKTKRREWNHIQKKSIDIVFVCEQSF